MEASTVEQECPVCGRPLPLVPVDDHAEIDLHAFLVQHPACLVPPDPDEADRPDPVDGDGPAGC